MDQFCKNIEIQSWEDFINQPLWRNPNVKVGGGSIFYKTYIGKNIVFFSDLLGKDKQFLKYEEISNNIGINTNFIQYNGLIHAINIYKNNLNLKSQENNITRPIQPTCIKVLNRDEKGCQTVYRILIENKNVPTAQGKWEREEQIPENFQWNKVYTTLHTLTKDTHLKWFQYRLQNRILATNTYLTKIGIKNSESCSFCNTQRETLKHLFYECDIVKNFWDSVKDWFNLKIPQHTFPNLTPAETIFGLTNTQDAEIINWIILVAKKYVYYNRIKNSVPCIQVFEKYLGMYFKTEKQVAFSNCEWKSFDNKWSMYKHIFEA